MNEKDLSLPIIVTVGFLFFGLRNLFFECSMTARLLIFAAGVVLLILLAWVYWTFFSRDSREKRKIRAQISEIPACLKECKSGSVLLGTASELKIPIFLPDHIRCRHVHILGATGSGKTESVILNFLRQDVQRGLGAIIIDAKGDISFVDYLKKIVPASRLQVFDLGSAKSRAYNPLSSGTPLESAQRLFSSLVWSEEYYRSRAFAALQRLFEIHSESNGVNPTLAELAEYLRDPDVYSSYVGSDKFPASLALKEFQDISGLRDQIQALILGHLKNNLSPKKEDEQVELSDAAKGSVIYFRLQSLMSPQMVASIGKLVINHLNFLAGTAHRGDGLANQSKLIPTFVDEFASFACPEFADLISKARSANLALHFSHQSIGDLTDVSKGFLSRITDNSATKIVMRINDPDSAEFMARSFGTREVQKVTQRITNAKEVDLAEVVGEGSARDAHRFRASPNLFKTLGTGVGSVLVAHGIDMPSGASSVFKIRFSKLTGI